MKIKRLTKSDGTVLEDVEGTAEDLQTLLGGTKPQVQEQQRTGPYPTQPAYPFPGQPVEEMVAPWCESCGRCHRGPCPSHFTITCTDGR